MFAHAKIASLIERKPINNTYGNENHDQVKIEIKLKM